MSALTPLESAQLADAVYGIRNLQADYNGEDILKGVSRRIGNATARSINQSWNFAGATVAHGESGMFTTAESGFAMAIPGVNERAGQTALLFRGTATMADWGSNLTIGAASGPAGLKVHKGFNKVYTTLKEQMKEVLRHRLNGQIHVVGHSLGGALASLMTAALACELERQPKLYTFGAPRVGFNEFSRTLEQRLQPTNMFRVYDIADPVPMVPVFPFVHSPASLDGLKVGTGGGLVNIPSHFMDNYTPRMEGQSWRTIAAPERRVFNARDVDGLLSMASQHVKIPMASAGLWALGKVLQALIDVSLLLVSPATTLAFTVIDKLASLLMQAAQTAKQLGNQLLKFMEMVLQWLGRNVVANAVEMTSAFLRYILSLLLTPIVMLAKAAFDRLI